MRLVCKAKDKNKIKKKGESDISVKVFCIGKDITIIITLLWASSIYCESKIKKQDLQAEES